MELKETKKMLSGNEAIALGAYEAGATVATGYPGTPSSEILEAYKNYPGVYAEWSVNEKVAFEVGLGASLAGARTFVTMKHVGLNVAADPLFTSSYIGVNGGLVIVTADDPNMYSSQNEQDNRNYALAAKLPMLEPADAQEAKDFAARAFFISETYDTPVLLRTVTRVSHAKGIVFEKKRISVPEISGFNRNIKKYVMIPAHARSRHKSVEKRIIAMSKAADTLDINKLELQSEKLGFITSGMAYNYVKESFPEASCLKLGLVYPLPEKLISELASHVDKLYVVEELDPFLENQIKAMGYSVEGKKHLPITGELSPDIIKKAFNEDATNEEETPVYPSHLPIRIPTLCPGCSHRKIFKVLNELNMNVAGDIGCYTLAVLPPFNAMDTCVEMGASVGIAQGIEIAEGKKYKNNTVAVIGDSTFAHSGISGLFNAAYNGRQTLVIVLDNGTTAMTGMQPNPFSGERISGEKTAMLDYEFLSRAAGILPENFAIVSAYDENLLKETVQKLSRSKGLSLMVVKGKCVINQKKLLKKKRTNG